MKLALTIVFVITLLAGALFYFTVDHPAESQVSMPWHIKVIDPLHIEVFGITLNQTTLDQARTYFGKLDGIALYQDKSRAFSLEAYFGKVSIGPIDARIIVNLDATQTEMGDLTYDALQRVVTENGSQKWTLKDEVKRAQAHRKIKSLTYIPGYSGLDEAFLIERFGQPDSRQTVDETTQLWIYPQKGVRIMLDSDGKEVFEYMVPAEFEQ